VRILGAFLAVAVAVFAVASASLPGGLLSNAPTRNPGAATPISTSALPSATIRVAPGYIAPSGTESVGALPPQSPLDVVVGIASRDPTGLVALVDAENAPGTPVYGTHLSAGDAIARFGAPTDAIQTAATYFEGYGLNVSAAPDGLLLYVDGPSASVGRAFGTTFEEYRSAAGRTFVSHPTPAVLPAIVPWSGVFGLGNVTSFAPSVLPPIPTTALPAAASCPDVPSYLTRCEVQNAYSIEPLIANGTDGAGYRLAVVDAYSGEQTQRQLETDLTTFTEASGLAVGNVSYLYPLQTSVDLNSTRTNANWSYEDALDLEWTRAMAPGASIEMTFSPDAGPGLYAAIDWLVGGDRADVISLSWGEPDVGVFDPYLGPCANACNASTDGSYAVLGPVLELAAVEGISVLAASGDCGASGGTAGDSTFFPASDPFVTGVGGTILTLSANGSYGSETGWPGNASGASSPGCSANPGGSGGGYSPFARPWWQVGPGTTGTQRGVPDVAADAGTYAGIVYDNTWFGVGGTSLATPIWAGITAIADQYAGTALGFLDPSLYRILDSSNYSADFHEITSGNNGYAAGAGWNPVTGIGSPIVSSLVKNLARPSNLTPSNLTTSVVAAPTFGPAPLTSEFTLSASGGSGTYPLEGIYFGDGNASLVTTGQASYEFRNAGTYDVQSFVFDSDGNESVSTPLVVVVGGGGTLLVHLAVSNATPAVGAVDNFTASVRGGTPPYSYSFFFGDGASEANATSPATSHVYVSANVYCPTVVVRDDADPPNAAVSSPTPVAVGGATGPGCGSAPPLISIAANLTAGVRDAPADFPSLFTITEGEPDSGLVTTAYVASSDPYTQACGCAVFRAPGSYTVQEWVNDTGGEIANASLNVTVAPPLDVTFAASTLSGPAPLMVQFGSSVTSGGYDAQASATRWNFGDGSGATGAAVSTTYDTPGEYLATGVLSDRGDGNASEAFLIDVEPPTGPTPLGVTATIAPAVNVSSGTTVRLAAQPVGPANETHGATILWDLGQGHSAYGDATAETYFGPLAPKLNDTLNLSLTIETAYLVPLVRIPFALTDFFAIEPGGFVPEADALDLGSTAGPATGVAPFEVSANASTTGPGGPSVAWSFGDGNGSSGPTTSHLYRDAGGFTLEAEATDSFGDLAVEDTAIAASAPLGVIGGPTPSGGTVPLSVRFDVSAVGGKGPPYNYSWTLPNGTQAYGTDLNLSFATVGAYPVTLNVTDSAGDHYERSWTVSVIPVPILSFAEVAAAGSAVGIVLAVVASGLWPRRKRPSPSRPRAERGGRPGG
jgi:hypothetical protein